ncbi:MAG TPA: type II toxin-antitoxin system Phd/YefM family antitoxin [Terriglobales bacterium]|nr:type II toxin-antitoxin system Phd/YefM family antitoxin [Terriglobales bacterium]
MPAASKPTLRHSWTVAEAKAKLSEVIGQAGVAGAQLITRRGKPAAIVVSPEEWRLCTGTKRTLAEVMASGRGLGPIPEPERTPWLPEPL